jgi:hypothetical protein
MQKDVQVSIPSEYDKCRVIVEKTGEKPVVESGFISFRLPLHCGNGTLVLGDKQVPIQDFYRLLREKGGLSDRLPVTLALNPVRIVSIDLAPQCYGGKKVWPFHWLGEECSVACAGDTLYLRIHQVGLEQALMVLDHLQKETLTLWRDSCPPEKLQLWRVTSSHYWHWQQGHTREPRPMETIYLSQETKSLLTSDVDRFLSSSALYDRYGVTWKRVILLSGQPGLGKSSTVLALATRFHLGLAKLTLTPKMMATDLESLFATAPANALLLLEDVDALFVDREAKSGVDFSTMLQLLDGVTTRRGLLLFMTTNHPERLDEALVRPGRVDLHVKFSPPGLVEWRLCLQTLAERWPHEHEQYLARLEEHPATIPEIQRHLFECMIESRDSIL